MKGIRSFLGLANFYCRFIANFAAVSKPLTSLTKKNVPFVWGVDQQLAFDTLKAKFMTAPVLAFLDYTLPMRLETDASMFAIDATLVICQTEEWKPAAYMSHSLSGAELNWSVYNKELFAIIKAFEAQRH